MRRNPICFKVNGGKKTIHARTWVDARQMQQATSQRGRDDDSGPGDLNCVMHIGDQTG